MGWVSIDDECSGRVAGLSLAGVVQQPVVQCGLAVVKVFQPVLEGQRIRLPPGHSASQGLGARNHKQALIKERLFGSEAGTVEDEVGERLVVRFGGTAQQCLLFRRCTQG
jgi:hypothetical protein